MENKDIQKFNIQQGITRSGIIPKREGKVIYPESKEVCKEELKK